MRRRISSIFLLAAALGPLAGCSDYEHRERPPWRAQAEEACLAKGLVRETAAVRMVHEMDGPGICGLTHPFKVTALAGGSVALNATETLDCPMIAALDSWLGEVVQPAARARFGEPVVRINAMGSYSCRGINNVSGANLSEHAFANAIDVGGFVLASGRELNIRHGFNGADEQERAFLHEAHAGACSHFTTVLGPGYNIFHYNHFHLDLAMHGSTSRGPRRYCKPVPQPNLSEPPARDNLPDPPPIEEEMDIARAPIPAPSYLSGPPALVASAPPPIPMRAAAYTPRPAASAMPLRASRPAREPELSNSGAEAPLITFGDAEDVPPRATAPYRRVEPLAEPTAAAPTDAADRTVRRARGPAAADGTPREWDITSSSAR